MKWFIFRVFVAYYFWSVMGKHGYSIFESWNYSGNFEDYFETAEWKSLQADAQDSVYEDFTYWTD